MNKAIILIVSLIGLFLYPHQVSLGQWCSGLRATDGSVFNDGAFNGNIIVGVGYSNEFDSLGKWAHIAAFDTSGRVIWQRRFKMMPYGSAEDNYFTTATALPNGDFLATMGTGSLASGITSLFVFNQNGDTTFFRTYDISSGEEYFNVAKVLSNGNVLIGGLGSNNTTYYASLIWFNPNNNTITRGKGYYFPATQLAPVITDFVQLNSKIYFVAYILGTNKSLVMCVDTLGNMVWNKVLISDNTLLFQLEGITLASDGNLYITGYRMGQDIYGSYGIVALSMDTLGNILWHKQYVSTSMPYLNGKGLDIYYSSLDNSLLISGYSPSKQQLLMKIDLSGQIVWSKKFIFDGEIVRIIPENNMFYLIGSAELVNQGSAYKVDYQGNSCCTSQYPVLLQSESFPLVITDTFTIGIIPWFTIATFSWFATEVVEQGQQDLCEPSGINKTLANSDVCKIIEHNNGFMLYCDEAIDEIRVMSTDGRLLWQSDPGSKEAFMPSLPGNLLIINVNLKSKIWTYKLLIF